MTPSRRASTWTPTAASTPPDPAISLFPAVCQRATRPASWRISVAEDRARSSSFRPSSLSADMPSSSTTLGHHHNAFVMAEASDQVSATGAVTPRLLIELRLRTPRERVQAEIHYLRMQVKFNGELLGEGTGVGDYVDYQDRRMRIEVPVTRVALAFVNDRLVGDRLDLTLALQGWMKIRYETAPNEPAYDPPPGEWFFTTFGVIGMAEISLQLPRSEWFKRILEPIGSHEYLLTEIPLLKGGADSSLRASCRQLAEAERHFAEGNDASVFFHCKGAIEALPGWPKEIFADIVDQSKATRLDDLVKSAKDYYDRGRHIAQVGSQQGDFPVNHREAGFALNMAKVLLAETAAVVGAG